MQPRGSKHTHGVQLGDIKQAGRPQTVTQGQATMAQAGAHRVGSTAKMCNTGIVTCNGAQQNAVPYPITRPHGAVQAALYHSWTLDNNENALW